MQRLHLALLLLLLFFLLLLPAATAFLLLPPNPPSSSPWRVLPAPKPSVLPLPALPQLPPACRTRRFVSGDQGDQQEEKPAGNTNPFDELERQLKGAEPPTVYVQQTAEGRMRIPLPPGPNRLLIAFSIGTALALGVLGVVVGGFVGVPPLSTLSLRPGGVATGLLLALPLFAVDFLLQGIQEDTASEVYALSIFGTKTRIPLVLGLAAAVTFATGFGEEVLFRGLIQEGLSNVLGGIGGLVAASLAFGLAHKMGPADITFITAAGAYMGLAYLVLHDLTVPIALHSTYDFLILASAYFRAKIRINPSQQKPPRR